MRHPKQAITLNLIVFLNALSYYGTRATIFVFLAGMLSTTNSNIAYSVYGYLSEVMIIGYVVSGLLGLLKKHKWLTVSGAALQLIGLILLMLSSSFEVASFAFILNIFGRTVHQTSFYGLFANFYSPQRPIMAGLSILYALINIGSFIGMLLVIVAEKTDPKIGFLIFAIASLANLLLILFLRENKAEETEADMTKSTGFNSILYVVFVVFIGVLVSVVYWSSYEMVVSQYMYLNIGSEIYEVYKQLNFALIVGVGIVGGIVFTLKRISIPLFLLIGVGFSIISLLSLSLFNPHDLSVVWFYLLFWGMAELFVVTGTYGIVVKKIKSAYIPLMVAGIGIVGQLANVLVNSFFFNDNIDISSIARLTLLPLIVLGIGLGVMIYLKKQSNNKSDLAKPI